MLEDFTPACTGRQEGGRASNLQTPSSTALPLASSGWCICILTSVTTSICNHALMCTQTPAGAHGKGSAYLCCLICRMENLLAGSYSNIPVQQKGQWNRCLPSPCHSPAPPSILLAFLGPSEPEAGSLGRALRPPPPGWGNQS